MVYNALVAVAIGLELGMTIEVKKASKISCFKMRMNIPKQKKEITLLMML